MANGDSGDIVQARLNAAQRKVAHMIYSYRTKGIIGGKPFAAAKNESRMIRFAESNGIELASRHFYISPRSIAHTLRLSKADKHLSVTDQALVDFIRDRRNMDLFWDGEGFVYTDYTHKFILNPSYRIKTAKGKERKVCFITAGIVTDVAEFSNSRYTKI